MERRKKYDKQFKIETVRYYEESDKSRKEIELELGITSGCLHPKSISIIFIHFP